MRQLVVLAGILFMLASCSAYVAAEHKSDPKMPSDGNDFVCAGGKLRHESWTGKAGYCKDVRGGGVVETRVEYEWRLR